MGLLENRARGHDRYAACFAFTLRLRLVAAHEQRLVELLLILDKQDRYTCFAQQRADFRRL